MYDDNERMGALLGRIRANKTRKVESKKRREEKIKEEKRELRRHKNSIRKEKILGAKDNFERIQSIADEARKSKEVKKVENLYETTDNEKVKVQISFL